MKIEYLGHSCFLMTTQLGTKLLTDPYTGIGYELPEQEADIVTCSHSHFDHAYLAAVRGTPQVFSAPGKYSCKDFQLEGFASFHDDVKGQNAAKTQFLSIRQTDCASVIWVISAKFLLMSLQKNSERSTF